MNLNKVFLIGRLTHDPEIRTTPSGQMVCNFGLATNRVWTNQQTNQREEKTEYHNIVLWRRLAEIASQYLKKGSLVLIEGRIQTRNWEDSSGSKRYKTEIVAENLQLGPKTLAAQPFGEPQPQKPEAPREKTQTDEIPIIEENYTPPSPQAPEKQKEEQTPMPDDNEEIDVRSIPF